MKKGTQRALLSVIVILLISASTGVTASSPDYDPWVDLNNDGTIDIFDIVALAIVFGSTGTPFEAKAAIEYDSSWLNITDQCGQSFEVVHNLNSTNIMVDLTGKTAADGGPHQRNLGGTGLLLGWAHTYGGADPDYGRAVISTADGGYAVAAHTRSYGAGDYDTWLIKTDPLGNPMWNRTYGGPAIDTAYDLAQTTDGGYIIVGDTASFGAGARDFWLVKTDRFGNLVWHHTYGGLDYDTGTAVIPTSDGGYAIVGNTRSFGAGGYDAWLVKTDASGTHQWNQTYGGTGHEQGTSVIQTSDGGYALTYTGAFGSGVEDLWLVKTDKQGNPMWSHAFDGGGSDCSSQVVETADGYVVAGYTDSLGAGLYDAWLIKTDRFGNPTWNQTYGGTGDEYGNSVIPTSDGGYALAGSTESLGAGQADGWLVKTDAYGDHLWNQTHGGANDDYGRVVVQTPDGGYVIVGETISSGAGSFDVWLVRASLELGLVWTASTADSITLYRGATDSYWNYVRVRVWRLQDTS